MTCQYCEEEVKENEPDEECPVHSAGPWPPRCEVCGRFMKRDSIYDFDGRQMIYA